jgi:hypothetical protein
MRIKRPAGSGPGARQGQISTPSPCKARWALQGTRAIADVSMSRPSAMDDLTEAQHSITREPERGTVLSAMGLGCQIDIAMEERRDRRRDKTGAGLAAGCD